MNAKSEHVTDAIVESILRANGYIDGALRSLSPEVEVCVQGAAESADLKEALSHASKSRSGNLGKPEFVFLDRGRGMAVVFEHKRDTSKHVYGDSMTEHVGEYAVNGALWYAQHLKELFDVIAVAVSGTDIASLRIDTYAWKRKAESFSNLNLHEIKRIDAYASCAHDEKRDIHATGELAHLNAKAKEINVFLREYLGVVENNRLYVLGAILAALEDPAFKMSYSLYNDNASLADYLYATIERRLKPSNIYNFEEVAATLKPAILGLATEKEGAKRLYPNGTLLELVNIVDGLLFGYWQNSEVDLISVFFNVFLSYSTSGGSDLGIVLTPSHTTKLFADIADVTKDSKVIDICCGTGGFLTAAWKRVLFNPDYSQAEIERFRQNNLLGIEKEPSIYTVLALNMFINKDGKSRIFNLDCFSNANVAPAYSKKETIADKLRQFEGTVGFINPPYSDEVYPELSFVELMLDSLMPGSIGVAIVPVNSISSKSKKHSGLTDIKRSLLNKHTLVASIQMPPQLFYPKGTETVVLVFKTGCPNAGETWLARYDDGYELIKHQKMRTPTYRSDELYNNLIEAYKSKSQTPFSFSKRMTPDDQWIYLLHKGSAYEVSREEFEEELQRTVNDYVAYLIANRYRIMRGDASGYTKGHSDPSFEFVPFTKLFSLAAHSERDKIKVNVTKLEDPVSVPYVSRSGVNNGVTDYVSPVEELIVNPRVITVALDGSTGSSFYQHHPFQVGQNIHVLRPTEMFDSFDPFVALYMVTSLRLAFREYSYNLSLTKARLLECSILVPLSDGSVDCDYIHRAVGCLENAGAVVEIAENRY